MHLLEKATEETLKIKLFSFAIMDKHTQITSISTNPSRKLVLMSHICPSSLIIPPLRMILTFCGNSGRLKSHHLSPPCSLQKNARLCSTSRITIPVTRIWFFPEMTMEIVGNRSSDFSQSRRASAVLMNRRNDVTSPTGLYRCEVLDSGGVLQSLYIGVYGDTGGECIIHCFLSYLYYTL